MNRKEKLYRELLAKNTKKSNDLILKIMWGFLVIICTLIITSLTKVFRAPIEFIIQWAIVTVCEILFLYLLRMLRVSEDIIKYLSIVVMLISILFGASSGSVGIYCVFILPAIVSIAYMDKQLSYITCLLCYMVCILSLFLGSEYKVLNTFTGYTREKWFVLYSIGYTLEFIGLVFGVHIVISRIEELMLSLSAQNERVINMQNDIIAAFAGLVESRDAHTGEHVKRTGNTVKIIIDSMIENHIYTDELDKKNAKLIEMAAPLHDIGKIRIPDAILCKPARLTEEEFSKMKYHTNEGKEIVDNYLDGMEEDDFINKAREIVLSHHERWDGDGYPNKLKEKEIPLSARIMAVADVFDALVSKRCYKDAIPFDEAYDIILEGAGKQFDPKIVEALTFKKEQLRKLYENVDEEEKK